MLTGVALWFPSAAQATNTCAINGGTKVGCRLAPLHFKIAPTSPGLPLPEIYLDKMSAANALGNLLMNDGHCPECTYGLLTSSFTPAAGTFCANRGLGFHCGGGLSGATSTAPRSGGDALIWGMGVNSAGTTGYYFYEQGQVAVRRLPNVGKRSARHRPDNREPVGQHARLHGPEHPVVLVELAGGSAGDAGLERGRGAGSVHRDRFTAAGDGARAGLRRARAADPR